MGSIITFLVLYGVLILARVAAFVAFFPLFGRQTVPRLVKIGLAVSLTVLWGGDILALAKLPKTFSDQIAISWIGFSMILAREIALGTILGYSFGLFLVRGQIAGEYLSQEMGLSFGNLVDPGNGLSGSPVTTFFDLLGTLLFLTLNVHHVLLMVFYQVFVLYPVGGTMLPIPLQEAVNATQLAQNWGLLIIAPVGLCMFLTTAVLALLSRSVPQMNTYAVGFPTRLLIGLFGTLILLPVILAGMQSVYQNVAERVLEAL